jgi:creatinine amidohydrolase
MSPTPHSSRWETLTKTQFDRIDRERAVVFVTCSPMEVHGPHLPLGADCLEGAGLAERALRFLPERHQSRAFLQLPFVWAACDGVPQPGTIAFRPSTTIAFLEDMGQSLARQGFRNVMVSNFHGSPRHFLAIETACERVTRAHGIRMASIFSLMLTRLRVSGSELGDVIGHLPGVPKADLAGDTHAGFVETAQLLALHPEWVDPEYKSLPRRTVDLWLAEAGRARPAGEREPRGLASVPRLLSSFKAGIQYFREESYAGAPAAASAEVGEQILDSLAGRAAEAISEILDGTLPPEQWHSPFWGLRHVFVNRFAVRLFDWMLGVPKPGG